MSDDKEDDLFERVPSMDTEEGRDAALEFLLDQNEPEDWVAAQVLQEDNDMVIRFRWADGREEVFDVLVRRSMEVVRKAAPGEEN